MVEEDLSVRVADYVGNPIIKPQFSGIIGIPPYKNGDLMLTRAVCFGESPKKKNIPIPPIVQLPGPQYGLRGMIQSISKSVPFLPSLRETHQISPPANAIADALTPDAAPRDAEAEAWPAAPGWRGWLERPSRGKEVDIGAWSDMNSWGAANIQ